MTWAAGSNSFSPDHRPVRAVEKGGAPFKMTAAKVRLAMAATGQKETKVTDLCSELAITRQTLYRHVAPDGTLRKDGLKVVEGGKIRYGKKK
jgi:hypothetical protein